MAADQPFIHGVLLIGCLFSAMALKIAEAIDAKQTPNEKLEHLKYLLFDKKEPKSIPRPDGINEIVCDMFVNSFDSISESSMDFTVNMMLYLEWKDPRLKWKYVTWSIMLAISVSLDYMAKFYGKSKYGLQVYRVQIQHPYNASYIELDEEHMTKIWQPDVYFPNEKTASFHGITIPNRLMRVYRSGLIFYANRITLTLSCPMDLRKYPLDKQECGIEMQSFGFTDDKLQLKWAEPHTFPYNRRMKMAQFNVDRYLRVSCHLGTSAASHSKMGTRSCVSIVFTLTRNMGFYAVQIYVPSVLIVMLSWVSFWLNVESVPARISMGVLTVLTMTTQSSGAGGSLPRVSYTKAIDIWMSTCLVFVFAALIEFAIANVFARKDRLKGFLTKNSLYVNEDTGFESVTAPTKQAMLNNEAGTRLELISQATKGNRGQLWARRLDLASRVLFPLTFGLFNLLYWLIYLYVIP